MKWMESWLQTSGINTLKPIIEYNGSKYIINIKQEKAKTGDIEVLREQLIDVAVLNIKKIAGVTDDEWDSDGDLELKNKVEVENSIERVLINATDVTSNVMELDEKPWAILVNYNNLGYCRIRFDLQSQTNFI